MTRALLFIWALLLCWPAFGATGFRIAVPTHDIPRGAILGAADLTTVTVTNEVMPGIVTSPSEIVGMQTRRVLRAGEGLRMEDLRRPILVPKGSTVTMTYEAPGITLTAVGRAMSEGGMGETVTVQNPNSFRLVSAVVVGPGQVRAQLSAVPRVASLQP